MRMLLVPVLLLLPVMMVPSSFHSFVTPPGVVLAADGDGIDFQTSSRTIEHLIEQFGGTQTLNDDSANSSKYKFTCSGPATVRVVGAEPMRFPVSIFIPESSVAQQPPPVLPTILFAPGLQAGIARNDGGPWSAFGTYEDTIRHLCTYGFIVIATRAGDRTSGADIAVGRDSFVNEHMIEILRFIANNTHQGTVHMNSSNGVQSPPPQQQRRRRQQATFLERILQWGTRTAEDQQLTMSDFAPYTIDPNQVNLVGHSLGAAQAQHVAAASTSTAREALGDHVQIKSAVLLAPICSAIQDCCFTANRCENPAWARRGQNDDFSLVGADGCALFYCSSDVNTPHKWDVPLLATSTAEFRASQIPTLVLGSTADQRAGLVAAIDVFENGGGTRALATVKGGTHCFVDEAGGALVLGAAMECAPPSQWRRQLLIARALATSWLLLFGGGSTTMMPQQQQDAQQLFELLARADDNNGDVSVTIRT